MSSTNPLHSYLHSNINDSPHLPSTPGLGDPLYTPPLGRDQHLQPSPSFLTAGNRDSSYANSLNSEAASAPGARASWGSNALVSIVPVAFTQHVLTRP